MNKSTVMGTLGILLVIAWAVLFGWMFFTVLDILEAHHKDIHVPAVQEQACNLPCKCKHLRNLGTWEWAECMGVGRK